jgi:two-component system chemotaxis response regulator CheY
MENSLKNIGLNLRETAVLIVDPNEFSRSFTKGLCTGFSFGAILSAGSTNEALVVLGQQPVDIVICDWVLPPMGGAVFIRQIRNSPLLTNPEVPIIVLTASSDQQTILAARDAGINGFLARPLSLARLLNCLETVLQSPLQFVRSEHYTGPDRRRKERAYSGAERRVNGAKNQVWSDYLRKLSDKVRQDGGMSADEMMKAGTQVMAQETLNYVEAGRRDLDEMFSLIRQMKDDKDAAGEMLERIFVKANELKGMGETFGYPLLTTTGGMLCELLTGLPPQAVSALHVLQAIETHATVMKMIIDTDLKDDQDELAKELVDGLQALVFKTASWKKNSPPASR